MTNPDYRAELQLLFDAAESFTEPALGHHRPWAAALTRARALLAQPVAEGPTDEELLRMAATEIGYEFTSSWFLTGSNSLQFEVAPLELLNLLRTALARWGRPTPQPVAVAPLDKLDRLIALDRDNPTPEATNDLHS